MRSKKSENAVIDKYEENQLSAMISNRFDTIKMMSDGFYHSIFNNLSVIIGQIELMREESLIALENDPDRTEMQLDKMEKASELINQILEPLFRINTLGNKGYCEPVSLKWVCENLPLYLSGYIQYLREKKNIKLYVETEISEKNINFILTGHVIDYVIPIILNLLKESICSGLFVVKFLDDSNANIIEIYTPKSLLSDIQPNILITEIMNQYQEEYSNNTEINDISLLCTSENEYIKLEVTLPINNETAKF